ncbi:MAG: isochorismatase family protein [Planctomycetes bacterium]|nr:isochorismatase family protein [Planctomycetota bacterium]
MADLNLRVRYFQDSTPAGVPCRESNFIRREIEMVLPVEATALVLVDTWNSHFIESWIERASHVMTEKLVPALAAARGAGLMVIHAPCPDVARQFPDHRPDGVKTAVAPPGVEPDWPPASFRRREGAYRAYVGPRSQPPGIMVHYEKVKDQLGMSPLIDVRPDEKVVATGSELHHVLAQRRILHLIYAGFAANWCLLGRDYGIRAMSRRGYHFIVLRDCTTGVEFPDTLDGCLVTEIAIREIEQQYGFSASNEDFFSACQKVRATV